MKLRQTILACIAVCASASAQTAMQLFNPAAKEYIYGNTPTASNLVEKALDQFPEDEKLLKLKKLIEEQQKQKDDQQQQQNDKKDQPQQKKQEQDQPEEDQQDRKEQSDQPQQQDQNKEQPQGFQPSPRPRKAGEMSREEAQQLLDAMKQNEQDQRADLTPFLGGPVRVEKDW